MRYVAFIAIALGLAGPAVADEQLEQKQDARQDAPVLLTETQLDAVVAGQGSLIDITVANNEIVKNVQVGANVNALVNANVLGRQGAVDQGAVSIVRNTLP